MDRRTIGGGCRPEKSHPALRVGQSDSGCRLFDVASRKHKVTDRHCLLLYHCQYNRRLHSSSSSSSYPLRSIQCTRLSHPLGPNGSSGLGIYTCSYTKNQRKITTLWFPQPTPTQLLPLPNMVSCQAPTEGIKTGN